MALRTILFLILLSVSCLLRGQQLTLIDHLDRTANFFGYSLVCTPAAIPDTSFVFTIADSAFAKTSFEQLTAPFSLTYNILANQVIITTTRRGFVTISGFVEDAVSGERLVGAAVYVQDSPRGTYTNGYGYFSLPKLNETDIVTVKYLGYPPKRILAGDIIGGRTTLQLRASYQLELVEIFPVEEELNQTANPGRNIPLGMLRTTEYIRGRPDLNAWVNMQPGVNSGATGFRGFSIRGADPDHNLVLLDDATLYLPSHAAGYMSIVPGEAIKSLQFFKNAGTARYGDRVGGVLDIRLRDGTTEKRKTNLNFGVSDLSFNTEGPIGKGSYFLSGRRGLTDFWLRALTPAIQPEETDIPNIDYLLYDIAAKVNYPLSPRQRIYASMFLGRDQYEELDQEVFRQNQTTQNEFVDRSFRSWSNLVSSLRYNLTIGSRWFSNTTLTVSQFNYDASDYFLNTLQIEEEEPIFDFSQYFYGTRLRDIGLRQDVEFAWKEGLSLKMGADAIQHRFEIGTLGNERTNTAGAPEEIDPKQIELPELSTYELSSYAYVDWQVNRRIDLNLGLRFSGQLGDDETFLAALPRISFNYKQSEALSFHGNAGLSRQFIHQVSTLNPGLPRDLWVPSVNGLTPQENRYGSLGLNYETAKKHVIGLEVFYNQLKGLSRFGNEVVGVDLSDWVSTIRRGEGTSYGAELKVNGGISTLQYDISYAFMVANRNFDGSNERFILDRRHFLTLATRYPLSESWGVGATWKIGSGLPGRVPDIRQTNGPLPPIIQPLTNPWLYSPITDELPVFHQLDLGFRFTKRAKTNLYNLSFGVQNIYLRRNALFINFQPTIGVNGAFTLVNTVPILPFLRYGITF